MIWFTVEIVYVDQFNKFGTQVCKVDDTFNENSGEKEFLLPTITVGLLIDSLRISCRGVDLGLRTYHIKTLQNGLWKKIIIYYIFICTEI